MYFIIKILLFFLLSFKVYAWTPYSWKSKSKTIYIQDYHNKKELKEVEDKLLSYSPLVTGHECDDLKSKIHLASKGKAFVLMGGDCAESFDTFTPNYVRDMYRLLLQMGIFLSYANGIPTVKIARMAGQYAKPRSENFETITNGTSIDFIESYKGDIINGYNRDERYPKADRMIEAYHQSTQTLNFLRSFSFGGYASVHNIDNWKLENYLINHDNPYFKKIKSSIRFMKGLDINIDNPIFTQTKIFTGHEALLLQYESPLTRKDSVLKKYYGCSGNFLWLGERTRDLDSPHVEYLTGINNPIGIKISSKCTNTELKKLIKKLNPNNDYGRITLITRFGKEKIENHLPRLIKVVKDNNFNVLWCCDPMHGNTKKLESGLKTRYFHDVWTEIKLFFDIHYENNTIPGGLHLEMTPNLVTECVDFDSIFIENMQDNYQSKCDPRLNGYQCISIVSSLCDLIIKKYD